MEEYSPTPFLYSDYIYSWLENSLDYGLTEADFWNMTLAEINRALHSKRRQKENAEKRQASYDYILADLIGKSISRIYSSSSKLPSIEDVYPSLFNSEDIKAQKQAKLNELSALRFKQFVNSHNKKMGVAE